MTGQALWSLERVRKEEVETCVNEGQKSKQEDWKEVEHCNKWKPQVSKSPNKAQKVQERTNRYASLSDEEGEGQNEGQIQEEVKVPERHDEGESQTRKVEVRRRWSKGQKTQTKKKNLDIMKKACPQRLNNVQTAKYELVEITVDSGAEESVTPPEVMNQFRTEETESSKNGEQFVAANGAIIENEGERKATVHTLDGVKRSMTFQVTTVNKALASVARINEKGHIVVFDGENSYIQNKATGEIIPLKKKQGTWVLQVWVEKEPTEEQGFLRQGA